MTMFAKIKIGHKTLVVPFSSRRTANSFVRGYNGYHDKRISNQEYACANPEEQRGARFAETIARYCEKHGIKQLSDRLEISEDTQNQQSLFDGFE